MHSKGFHIKNYTLGLFICIVSIFATLLALELFLRAIHYNPFAQLLSDPRGRHLILRTSKNIVRAYEAVPHARGYAWGGDVTINSYGFRDNEYPINKDKDGYRIVVIGDSITFGNGVSAEDTFPKQLEVFFRQEGRNIEVLNLGLGGYDTLQEVATLEDIGLQFSPDLVVVGYCVNDISTVSPNLDYIERAQRYSSPIYKLRLLQLVRVNLDKIAVKAFTEKMQSDSEFVKKNQHYIADISKDDGVCALVNDLMDIKKKYGDHYTNDYTSLLRIGKLRYSFERLKVIKDKYRINILLLIIPFFQEDDSSTLLWQATYKIVEFEAVRCGFQVLSAHSLFKSTGFPKVCMDPIHPNRAGHKLIAQLLYDAISSKYLLSSQDHQHSNH